jgi:hypothetical protein
MSVRPVRLKNVGSVADPTRVHRIWRWTAVAALLYGIFVGISYAITPVVSPGDGNAFFSALGIALIAICSAALLRLPPRRRQDGQRRQ